MELNPARWTYGAAFERNLGLIPPEHQAKLRASRVGIAGLGGVGGIYATALARLGVGKFALADMDSFEPANFNRQQGAYLSTLDHAKNRTMERIIKDINPEADVRVFEAFTADNAEEFLDGAALALDALDFFSIAPRRLLYRKARERGIPVLGAAPVGFGTSMLNVSPHGMSFEEYFNITDGMSEEEQIFQFALGLTPRLLQRSYLPPKNLDFKVRRGPSSVLGTLAAATMVGTEAYKIICGMPYEHLPVSWQFDPYVRKFRRCNLWLGNRNPIQLAKKWYFKKKLAVEFGARTA